MLQEWKLYLVSSCVDDNIDVILIRSIFEEHPVIGDKLHVTFDRNLAGSKKFWKLIIGERMLGIEIVIGFKAIE